MTKLSATSGKDSEEIQKLNEALKFVERSKSLDNELRRILNEYTNDLSNGDLKLELLQRINSKFQESSGDISMFSNTQQLGVPSLEYEQYRRRVGTNILELWNFISSEAQKIEKSVKNEIDSQQSLKQLSNFVQLAREHSRFVVKQTTNLMTDNLT